jgi:hypothetical protein
MIFERTKQNPTKRNYSYVAKDFAWLQPKRTDFQARILYKDEF